MAHSPAWPPWPMHIESSLCTGALAVPRVQSVWCRMAAHRRRAEVGAPRRLWGRGFVVSPTAHM
eukprot:scaffold1954_cov113-Isochrysis_galbana.AAC.7